MEDFTIVILASIPLKNVTDKNRSNAHKNLPVLIETGKGTFAVACVVLNIIELKVHVTFMVKAERGRISLSGKSIVSDRYQTKQKEMLTAFLKHLLIHSFEKEIPYFFSKKKEENTCDTRDLCANEAS
ncbi:uncharacterized protein LOC122571898 isoform X1 [Bombus pyrosoma]|uniref:uncharacterized protein LOC122571898 isoform X1 n=1 Tax=Bombus pyrosoma TaxID=396416 RepID=UPI001CB9C1F5|nr:uncharacterized protein LOC122571898 isoform X1 [Bombus pyrosoma]